MRQAEQMGVPPERLAQQLADNGQLSFAAAEVLRGKAMNLIAERVKVTDPSGQDVDIKAALNAPMQSGAAGGEVAADDDAEVMAETDPEAESGDSLADTSASAAEETHAEETAASETPAKGRAAEGKAKAS
jgi:hypothetical protein